MRSLLMVGVLFFAVAGSSMAQDYPEGEVAGNYTYIRINPGGTDCHGGGGSGAYSLNHYLGVVGEFSGCKVTGLPSGVSAHAFTYLFGPRLTYRAYGRLEPFGEVLLGGAHLGATGGFSDNAFGMAIVPTTNGSQTWPYDSSRPTIFTRGLAAPTRITSDCRPASSTASAADNIQP
jgi:hypothetical protein